MNKKLPLPSKTQILNQIETTKELNRQFKNAHKNLRELSSYLQNFVKQELQNEDKSFRIFRVSDIMGGSACVDWEPEIILYNHNNIRYIGNRRFVISKGGVHKIYSTDIIEKELPFDAEKLLDFCDKMTDLLGIPVGFHVEKIVDQLDGPPQYINEIKFVHKNGKILAEGTIQYVGWDCDDDWVVVEDVDGKHFYYGTTAHGGGFNAHIAPGGDYSEAKNFFERDDVVSDSWNCIFSYLKD